MPLLAYRKKRDFRRTPEPRGVARASRGALRYVIQKHAATRLHYDFRLELDGALKSWAVPKGPSLDPAQKRLAVEVEDHPLEYGGFEGVIPAGQYGGGTVLLWDRGTWTPTGDPHEGLRKGRLDFELHGEKLRGGFSLIRMRGDGGAKKNWLLVKRRDAQARSERGGGILEERPESVATGKGIEEIAASRKKVWNSDRAQAAPAAPARRVPPRSSRATARTKGALDPASLPGARRAAMPARVTPQLATLVKQAPAGEEWLHEIKFDGYRVLGRVDRGRATMITRGGKNWTERFEGIAEAVAALGAGSAILDGEAAVVLSDGSTSFQALQNQLRLGKGSTLAYFVFDLLYLEGYDLKRVPLRLRKETLERLVSGAPAGGIIRYSDHVEGKGERFHAEACRRGLEGIVSKRSDSMYVPGRSGLWLKAKCASRQEFVIGGYTEPQSSRAGLGALLLGTHENGRGLRYRGRVGTGFTHETLRDLQKKLARLETKASPFSPSPRAPGAHWVRPKLVAEVSFTSWTDDGKLRHPSFAGLRDDKSPRDVVRETPVPARAAGGGAGARKRVPPARRRPPDTPPRRRPAVRDPNPKPAVEEPPSKPRKRPIREPVDQAALAATVAAGGQALTNPGRVLYPELGLTKADLARYFLGVAPFLLAHAAGRPLMLARCPAGRTRCFFQKHPSGEVPSSLGSVRIREKDGTGTYLVLRDQASLVTLAQMGVLEIHIWGSRADDLEYPDRVVFDFDAPDATTWKDVVRGAVWVRERLDGLGLKSFVKTTGGHGIHVVVPTRRGPGWDDVKDFSAAVAAALVRESPDRFTTHLSKARRGRRIFIDTLRNRRGSTWVAPYSPRARTGAPVSMPISWEELTPRMRPDAFSMASLLRERGGIRADAWKGIGSVRQTLTPSMVRRALQP